MVSTVSTYFAMVSTTVSTVSTSVAVKPQPSWGVGWLVIKNACNLMFECIYVVLFVGNAIERFSHGGLRSDNAPIKKLETLMQWVSVHTLCRYMEMPIDVSVCF